MLTPGQRALVREIVQRVVPGATFGVFGSRATGRARPYSDLDLLITEPKRLSWRQRVELRDAFETSDLPFCVDVVEGATLAQAVVARVQQELRAV